MRYCVLPEYLRLPVSVTEFCQCKKQHYRHHSGKTSQYVDRTGLKHAITVRKSVSRNFQILSFARIGQSSSSNRSCEKRHSNISTYSRSFSKPVSEIESDEQEQFYSLW